MTNDAQRIFKLEGIVAKLQSQVASLQIAVGQLQQNAIAGAGNMGFGGGGGGAGAFFCMPSATVVAASGTFPSLTATAFTANVYQANGNSLTLIKTGASCFNFMSASLEASLITYVVADGQGNYDAVEQVCPPE